MPGLREQLLDAVVQVLATDGPLAVTTRRIAIEAGCSEGSIYNHFATKQDLVACAIGERFRFPGRLEELANAPGSGDPREQLREVVELAVEFLGWVTSTMASADRDPEVMHAHARRVHADGIGPWRSLDRLADWLAAEQRLGRLHPDADPHAAATAVLGACMWQAVLVRSWGPALAPDRDTAIERAVAAVWSGLRPD
ncbi:MAG: TetR/AcrR family transcriptional regulator [Nitriliruptoraceae bacterium]|nr:TetR/AcrR family transcriptional regulator [Nitriliruptoraceae bacterium]